MTCDVVCDVMPPGVYRRSLMLLFVFFVRHVFSSAVNPCAVDVNPDVALNAKFLIPNILAWCIGMQVQLASRQSVAFCRDVTVTPWTELRPVVE